MQFSAIFASAIAFTGLAAAQVQKPFAQITVESSHGGAGNGLVNKTMLVGFEGPQTSAVLKEVSTLYLTGANGVDINTVVCQPHKNADGSDTAAKTFDVNNPGRLSTNTVVIGSITCRHS
ncbi:hypothetical protein F5Y00DRAFT_12147 [Daldinia vernicosa]|uniref:uncharacterized protein n=1 Tax=Daldinia vernicosa TaxID=114800 RepID=UPI0020089848|nr:uncharacterized protein F5Y00DRAFT_12147 [Daldinia vernicosa]KAI0851534.1 hypothetical protein F5Y00DRAFT_12147 [Daldinia vernicosa]